MASEMAEQFRGLPMADLIGGPLTAVCDAQLKLAASTFDYIDRIAFNVDRETVRLLEFDVNRPVETPDGYANVPTHVQAPLISLVPIPSLLVEDVVIEFQMEVSATTASKEAKSKEGSMGVTAGFKGFGVTASVTMAGKIGSSRENTRSTNQSAKYQVRVNAKQQKPTEGLARLMDAMADCAATTLLPSTGARAKSEFHSRIEPEPKK